MKRFEKVLTACALAWVGSLPACGEDEKPGTEQADAGDTGGRSAQELCLRREDLTEVLAPSDLGGAFSTLTVDGGRAYFSVGTRLYRASSTGQPELLFDDASSFGLAFSVQGERILAATDTAVFELAGGVNPEPLAKLPAVVLSDLFTGSMPFVFAGQRAYFAGSVDARTQTALYAVDLATGQTSPLGDLAQSIGVLVHEGDALYWAESSSGSAPYANKLMRMPVGGGTAEEVSVDLGARRLQFDLVGSTSGAALLDVSIVLGEDNSDDEALTVGGIYTQSLAGGKARQLLETSPLGLGGLFGIVPSVQVVEAGSELFMRTGTLQDVTIHSIALDETSAKKRFCVELGDALVEAMAVVDGAVYLALAGEDNSYILRRDL